MLLKKKGYPQEDELVLCTVTAVQHHSVFAKLDEYEKSGLIHISEVSPGRIRNIRDFVREGKVIVCKVLRVSEEKGHIDLSLRRVNDGQKRAKMEEVKKEQFAEKIIKMAATQFNLKTENLYSRVAEGAEKKYDTLYSYFEAVSDGAESLKKLELDEKITEALEKIIKEKIKPEEICIGGKLMVQSHAPDGISQIKKALSEALKTKGSISMTYDGAGKYQVKVTSTDFKDAEKVLDKLVSKVLGSFQKAQGTATFKRDDD